MSKLTDMIQKASQQYYSDGSSPLSDAEFDNLLGQLKEEDPTSPLLNTGHGYDVSKTSGTKVKHRYGLVGSLNKCHSWIEIPKGLQNKLRQDSGTYALKLDGLSVVLYYVDGHFEQAVTRGDGTAGIDITDKVIRILTNQLGEVPVVDTTIFPNFTGAIRGEILMSDRNFEIFQKHLHPEAKNSRNSTAGIINSKGVTDEVDYLNLLVYRIVGIESEVTAEITYNRTWEALSVFDCIPDGCYTNHMYASNYVNNTATLFDDDMQYLKERWYHQWPADGIVITANQVERVGNELIYDSIAYKYPSEVKESKVIDILWDMSKTNYLIPRIQIEPVEIAGSTVQFCTGIHAQAIQSCGVGPRSTIKITKANEIIPQMLEVIDEHPIELPKVCPECRTELVWNGVHLQCLNRQCKNLQKQDVLCWFHALAPLDGLGDTLILKYIEEMFGKGATIERLYDYGKLANNTTSVQKGLFIKAYNKLFEGPIKLEDAIKALNIPRFGDITATKCTKYANEFKYFVETGNLSEKLKSLGAANFESLQNNIDKLSRLHLIKDQIDWEDAPKADKGEVCITGKLSVKRSVFEAELKAAGFTIASSVKKTTKYLITDNPNSGSSKNTAADKYNVPKVTESEFREKILNLL